MAKTSWEGDLCVFQKDTFNLMQKKKSATNMIRHSLLLNNLHIFPKKSAFKVEIIPK